MRKIIVFITLLLSTNLLAQNFEQLKAKALNSTGDDQAVAYYDMINLTTVEMKKAVPFLFKKLVELEDKKAKKAILNTINNSGVGFADEDLQTLALDTILALLKKEDKSELYELTVFPSRDSANQIKLVVDAALKVETIDYYYITTLFVSWYVQKNPKIKAVRDIADNHFKKKFLSASTDEEKKAVLTLTNNGFYSSEAYDWALGKVKEYVGRKITTADQDSAVSFYASYLSSIIDRATAEQLKEQLLLSNGIINLQELNVEAISSIVESMNEDLMTEALSVSELTETTVSSWYSIIRNKTDADTPQRIRFLKSVIEKSKSLELRQRIIELIYLHPYFGGEELVEFELNFFLETFERFDLDLSKKEMERFLLSFFRKFENGNHPKFKNILLNKIESDKYELVAKALFKTDISVEDISDQAVGNLLKTLRGKAVPWMMKSRDLRSKEWAVVFDNYSATGVTLGMASTSEFNQTMEQVLKSKTISLKNIRMTLDTSINSYRSTQILSMTYPLNLAKKLKVKVEDKVLKKLSEDIATAVKLDEKKMIDYAPVISILATSAHKISLESYRKKIYKAFSEDQEGKREYKKALANLIKFYPESSSSLVGALYKDCRSKLRLALRQKSCELIRDIKNPSLELLKKVAKDAAGRDISLIRFSGTFLSTAIEHKPEYKKELYKIWMDEFKSKRKVFSGAKDLVCKMADIHTDWFNDFHFSRRTFGSHKNSLTAATASMQLNFLLNSSKHCTKISNLPYLVRNYINSGELQVENEELAFFVRRFEQAFTALEEVVKAYEKEERTTANTRSTYDMYAIHYFINTLNKLKGKSSLIVMKDRLSDVIRRSRLLLKSQLLAINEDAIEGSFMTTYSYVNAVILLESTPEEVIRNLHDISTKLGDNFLSFPYYPKYKKSKRDNPRSASARSPGVYLSLYMNKDIVKKIDPTTKIDYTHRLYQSILNWGVHKLDLQLNSFRFGTHEGEDSLGTHYYYPSLPHVMKGIRLLLKDDDISLGKKLVLKEIMESVITDSLILVDKDEAPLSMTGEFYRTFWYESKSYSNVLLGNALIESLEL